MRQTRKANKDGKLLLYPEGKPSGHHYVITAWNPGGFKQSAYENAVNHKLLLQALRDISAITGSAEIFDSEKSWRMNGFYIMGVEEEDMKVVARKIKQNIFYEVDSEGQKKPILVPVN